MIIDRQPIWDLRRARELKQPMLSVIREHGPITMNDALLHLKQERRCGRGVTLRAGYTACEMLQADGLIRPRGGQTIQAARFEWEAL